MRATATIAAMVALDRCATVDSGVSDTGMAGVGGADVAGIAAVDDSTEVGVGIVVVGVESADADDADVVGRGGNAGDGTGFAPESTTGFADGFADDADRPCASAARCRGLPHDPQNCASSAFFCPHCPQNMTNPFVPPSGIPAGVSAHCAGQYASLSNAIVASRRWLVALPGDMSDVIRTASPAAVRATDCTKPG